VVKLQLGAGAQRVTFKKGVLKIKAPSFLLTVICQDGSGNLTTVTASPVFGP